MPLRSFVVLGALAFATSGAFNIVADFTPDAVMRLLNFSGVCLGILGLQALYVFAHQRTGATTLAAATIATLGFTGIAGFLFTDAFVFPALDDAEVAALTSGSTGMAIFGAVILYVLGVLLFAITLLRSGLLPKVPLLLWATGTLPTLAAIALPPVVMTLAEITASIGVIWIAVEVLRRAGTMPIARAA